MVEICQYEMVRFNWNKIRKVDLSSYTYILVESDKDDSG